MGRDFRAKPFISHALALDGAPRMFAEMAARRVWYSKVVVIVSEEAREEQRSES